MSAKMKIIATIGLCVIILSAFFIYRNHKTSAFQLQKSNIIYGNYAYGDYYLSLADPETLKVRKKIKVTRGWTDKIYTDGNYKIYIPLNYQPDMTTPENKVVMYDINKNKDFTIKVGYMPHYIFFKNNYTYVLCEEDGITPTVYRIDHNLHAKKMFAIKNGGLISNAIFDGNYIYFNAEIVKDDKQFPILAKVSLNGKIIINSITKTHAGINNLLLFDNKLIMGLQAPKNQSTLAMFNPITLKRVGTLDYKEMVGDLMPLNNNSIAVTDVSKVAQKGKKISIIDVEKNKIVKTFNTEIFAEQSNYRNNKFIVVDNLHNKTQILNSNGESVNIINNTPTQVSNLLYIEK